MCFGPVNATCNADGCSPLLASAGKPAGRAGDLMEALEARHLTSRSRTRVTGRTTVYFQASATVSILALPPCQRLTATLHPARASLVSGAPANHPQDHQEHPRLAHYVSSANHRSPGACRENRAASMNSGVNRWT